MPSDTQIALFLTAPDQFLKSNSLVWLGAGPDQQGIIDAYMLDDTGKKARVRTGNKFLGLGNSKANADKFQMKWGNNPMNPAAPGTKTFQVHWSGYKAGQGRDAELPAGNVGPDIMLTPEFTGCTAVCRTAADGSAQFSHYNLMSPIDTKLTLGDDDMHAIADAAYGSGHSTVTKGDVRSHGKHSDAVKATVVGFRRQGRWEFWIQIRESKSSGEQIRAVRKL